MKLIKIIFLSALLCLFTACSDDNWHPQSTEVVFEKQEISIELMAEDTDFGAGSMDYYKITALAKSETSPYYTLNMTALVGIKQSADSVYTIEDVWDVQVLGSADNMDWQSLGSQPVVDIWQDKDAVVLWENGKYHTERDKEVKNISHFLLGKFFKYKKTVKENFYTDTVSLFVKLYADEIVSCSPQPYHITAKSTENGATFG